MIVSGCVWESPVASVTATVTNSGWNLCPRSVLPLCDIEAGTLSSGGSGLSPEQWTCAPGLDYTCRLNCSSQIPGPNSRIENDGDFDIIVFFTNIVLTWYLYNNCSSLHDQKHLKVQCLRFRWIYIYWLPPLIPLELCLHSASQQQGPVRAALHTSCCCFSLWILRTQLSLRPHTLSSSHSPSQRSPPPVERRRHQCYRDSLHQLWVSDAAHPLERAAGTSSLRTHTVSLTLRTHTVSEDTHTVSLTLRTHCLTDSEDTPCVWGHTLSLRTHTVSEDTHCGGNLWHHYSIKTQGPISRKLTESIWCFGDRMSLERLRCSGWVSGWDQLNQPDVDLNFPDPSL